MIKQIAGPYGVQVKNNKLILFFRDKSTAQEFIDDNSLSKDIKILEPISPVHVTNLHYIVLEGDQGVFWY